MRIIRSRSILGVALTVGAILLVGQPSVAAPPAPIPMPVTVIDNLLPFTTAPWDFDVDDNDYAKTLSDNGYMQDATGLAAWTALQIQCKVFTAPAKGTLVQITGPGKGSLCDWTYTPTAAWNGTDTMTYVIDYLPGGGGPRVSTTPQTVNFSGPVTPPVQTPVTAPIVLNDAVNFTTTTGGSFNVDTNDKQTTLTTNGWVPGTVAGEAQWTNLAVQCQAVGSPAHGAIVLLASTTCGWGYTPDSTFTGTDTMTYRMAYGPVSSRVLTGTATVNFTGPAPASPLTAPTLVNDSVAFTSIATTRNFGVKSNDYETTLAAANLAPYTLAGNAAWDSLFVLCKVATPPAHGSLILISGVGYGSECDWIYTPNAGFTGTDSMTYKMEYKNATGNRVLTTATATVNFTGPVSPPITTPTTPTTTTTKPVVLPGTVAPKFVPLSPARLLETRPGNVTFDGAQQGQGTSPAGSITEVQITGRSIVPDGATAVVLNVTATGTKAPGFLTMFPCGQTTPTASNLNYGNDTTIANAVTTKIGTSGKVCIYTSAETNLITDINGYYPA